MSGSGRTRTIPPLVWVILGTAVAVAVVVPQIAGRVAQFTVVATAGILAVITLRPLVEALPLATRSTMRHIAPSRPQMPRQVDDVTSAMKLTHGASGRGSIVGPVVWHMSTIATGKLWDRHRLNLHNPEHAAAILAVVSPDLWELVGPARRPDGTRRVPRSVPITQLGALLQELEQL